MGQKNRSKELGYSWDQAKRQDTVFSNFTRLDLMNENQIYHKVVAPIQNKLREYIEFLDELEKLVLPVLVWGGLAFQQLDDTGEFPENLRPFQCQRFAGEFVGICLDMSGKIQNHFKEELQENAYDDFDEFLSAKVEEIRFLANFLSMCTVHREFKREDMMKNGEYSTADYQMAVFFESFVPGACRSEYANLLHQAAEDLKQAGLSLLKVKSTMTQWKELLGYVNDLHLESEGPLNIEQVDECLQQMIDLYNLLHSDIDYCKQSFECWGLRDDLLPSMLSDVDMAGPPDGVERHGCKVQSITLPEALTLKTLQ